METAPPLLMHFLSEHTSPPPFPVPGAWGGGRACLTAGAPPATPGTSERRSHSCSQKLWVASAPAAPNGFKAKTLQLGGAQKCGGGKGGCLPAQVEAGKLQPLTRCSKSPLPA
ncbi:unnamed protein product [Rangifer tarandus platyrhynchus]|uniref:Uncharacterized protein n=1 Tax=Rangifer tarandus platyrhynchus TaxID=3082113 RepID=A0AC59ZET8_RANTA